MSPEGLVPREYAAHVTGAVNFENLKRKLASGVETADGVCSGELLHAEELTGLVYIAFIKFELILSYI